MAALQTNDRPLWEVEVYVLPMTHPADWSGLRRLLEEGTVETREVVAVAGKTEGNGCVNDYTRPYAVASLEGLLREFGLSSKEYPVVVMSGGTEGILSPHATIFVRHRVEREAGDPSGPALMIAARRTPELAPENLGRLALAHMVAETVLACLDEARISPPDVAFVQVKCPLLTSARVAVAGGGQRVVTTDTYKSMALSRAASALGVALALGEIRAENLADEKIGQDWSLYSNVASTSSGIELTDHEVFVLGHSPLATGPLRIGHDVMENPIDCAAFERALVLAADGIPGERVHRQRLVQVLAKAEAPPDGLVLGARHTMLEDSDIPHSRMARAVVGAVLAAATGRTHLYVSSGAEHQGPPGGGPVAVIYHKG